MQDIWQFIMKHWLLCLALIIVIILIIIEEIRSKGRAGLQLAPSQVIQLINRDQAGILDIRDQNAFREGHIIGAINIPQADLERNMNQLNKFKQVTLVVVCASGMKSAEVASTLRKQGFEKVAILTGGLNAWKNAGLPIIKDK